MPAGNAPNQTRRVVSVPIPSTGAGALQFAKAAPAPPNRQPAPRVFTPPPSSRGQAEPIPAITLDQPPAIPSNTTLPPSMGLPTTLSKLPAPPAIQPPVNQPPATRQVRIGGNVQAANLIRRVTPLYPPAAKLAHIQGDVRFTALIGKDGAVRNLQVIGGSPTLIQAALDAVKQWIYRPTLLNGEPVEVITQIDVLFTLNP
jgi:protein TonB